MRLEGKTAFVTGGCGGIGRAICARFIKEGARVYAADLSAQGSMDDSAETGATFVKLDVTSEDGGWQLCKIRLARAPICSSLTHSPSTSYTVALFGTSVIQREYSSRIA